MKALPVLPLTLLCLLAVPVWAVPVDSRQSQTPPVQESDQDRIKAANDARQAEIDEMVRKLNAMGFDFKRPVENDDSEGSAQQQPEAPVNSGKSVRSMSIGDLLDYQDQLRDRLAQLEDKERKAKEKDRLRAETAKKAQTEKNEAIHQLREVEAELGDVLIRRALKGVGKMVPAPKFNDYDKTKETPEAEPAPEQAYSEYPEHEYIDYEIEAPVLMTGKPARKIRVKARKGVMELHQEIQDLNKVLIDSAKRMTGKPF
ncbi:hypothetical protein GZ77_14445 [Endozoicomonas montiporae]|uniref:Uncharacterized protein n=2 Tax=Endozoicomonas montiporae TaxID=1027273 RepID=A0A081N507_9GAMM|nr:hypothetical protein [Endozoicomonas montiporae]AMO57600.1 hypothetical protein EZMO1_3621 [Endozoicomonas montiporae CL-33]KEQ13530.1 hypothetical protein GZ77_14445 [Endozoicomonas montiporae]